MKKYIPILKNTRLFAGLSEEEIDKMLSCLGARLREYKKGEYVFRQGDRTGYITVLVAGRLHIGSEDYWGNRSLLGSIEPGEMFGEAYAAPDSASLLNDVVAVENSAVVFFDVKCVITTCPSACCFHSTVVQNLFLSISAKNRGLVQKLGHMSKRTTREKLISYLSEEAKKNKSPTFMIPYNRQQLADYLSVDRSAMSAELCRMRDDGLIEFEKNAFKLL